MSEQEATSTALETTGGPSKGTLQWYLAQPAYQNRFNQLLGQRAPQFMASLLNIAASSRAFKKVEPTSILAAGAIAATLDLPIDKNLGFAWVIPYGNLAQFQLGYKGVIQLALRSGQYAGMNAICVNEEALGSFDDIGDRLIHWDKIDETKPPVGYAFAWKLTTGFTKIVYWPKDKVEAHAKRYSQAYKAGKKDSPWFTDFDKMALKTLITNALKRWGMLSVEIQSMVSRDQSAAIDIDSEPIYIDNEESGFTEETENGASSLADELKARRTNGEDKATDPAPAASTPDPPAQREPGDESERIEEAEAITDTAPELSAVEIKKAKDRIEVLLVHPKLVGKAFDILERAAGAGIRKVNRIPSDKLYAVESALTDATAE